VGWLAGDGDEAWRVVGLAGLLRAHVRCEVRGALLDGGGFVVYHGILRVEEATRVHASIPTYNTLC
jgi:hypothetical protein